MTVDFLPARFNQYPETGDRTETFTFNNKPEKLQEEVDIKILRCYNIMLILPLKARSQ